MSKSKTPIAPQIEYFKSSELQVEDGFNVRAKPNFNANVKELQKLVEARGEIDPSMHVVQYVERDGRKLVRGGHTTRQVGENLGLKVPAIRVEMDAHQEQVNLVTGNAGHPLSPYEQGEVYMRLRDGLAKPIISAEVATGDDWLRKPLTVKEIAERVGYTAQHVANCLVVRESDPEIGQLVIDGKVSANAVILASKNVKSKAKVATILRAAVGNAKENGKETATESHVRAVKDQFMDAPKLTAVSGDTNEGPGAPAAPHKKAAKAPEAAAAPEDSQRTLGDLPGAPEPQDEPGELALTTEPQADAKAKLRDVLKACADVREMMFSDGDLDYFVETILASDIPF